MTSRILGIRKSIRSTPLTVTYYYTFEDESHWPRIRDTYLLFSDQGLTPRVIHISNDDRSITVERIIPLDHHTPYNLDDVMTRVTELIDRMHGLGYAHGDLITENLGYDVNGRFYLLDLDTVYRIDEEPPEWLQRWMDQGFDWDGTFEEFVAYDYENWIPDW